MSLKAVPIDAPTYVCTEPDTQEVTDVLFDFAHGTADFIRRLRADGAHH